jgi:hypothetical protein
MPDWLVPLAAIALSRCVHRRWERWRASARSLLGRSRSTS